MKPKTFTNLISSNFIFIGGLTRSGKSFLCPIVSSFKRTEMFLIDSIIENISYMNAINKINFEAAKYLIQLNLNERAYNQLLSRNVNFRKLDYSSVINSKNYTEYKKRLLIKDGDSIVKKIKKKNPIFPVMFHDVLINPKLLLESFPKAKIIYIERDPVDLVSEWIKKEYSGDFFSNPRNVTLSFKFKKKIFPYWCFDKTSEYLKIKNNFDKVVFLLNNLLTLQKKNYHIYKKKNKKNILYFKFDQLVTNTDKIIKKISKTLGTELSKHTNSFIKKARGNRVIDKNKREKSRSKIVDKLSPKYKKIFFKLEKNYKNTF